MKKYFAVLLMVIMIFGCAACGSTGDENEYARELDEEDFAKHLAANITFTDMMSEVDEDTAEVLYGLYGLTEDDYDDLAVYMSTGATAEEIAVVSVDSDAQAEKVTEVLKARIAAQIKSFENYVPGEVNKLSDAIVEQVDNCIVLAVCNDYDEYHAAKDDFLKNIAAVD